MKKLASLTLVMFIVLALALPVAANGPGPDYFCSFTFKNLPENTAYVDLLIKLSPEDAAYKTLNNLNLPKSFSAESPIAVYSQDGYCSYSLHYAYASMMIEVKNDRGTLFDKTLVDLRTSGKADQLKLAMIDGEGNILQVSAPHSFQNKTRFIFMELVGQVYYDAQADTLEIPEQVNLFLILTFVFLSIGGLALTLVVEYYASWPFGLDRKFGKLILLTNLVSQLLMRLVDLLIRGFIGFDYVYMVLILEVLVYTGEFLFYRKKMLGVSWKKCLLYTFTANTLSLVLGLLMFRIVL